MDEETLIKKKKMEDLIKRITKIDVNDENFEESVIEQSKRVPIVVDFWAPWCAPCLVLSPILEKLADEYKGKFVLAKMNVAESKNTAQRYDVMSIPNVKMFKDGKVVDEFIGAIPEPMVRKWLEKNLD